MVERHSSIVIGGATVKRARPRPRFARPQRCIWPGCRAVLPHDHPSPICSCHLHEYRLEHDKGAARLVCHLLCAAYPDAIDLSAVLCAAPAIVKYRVNYLRRRGWPITGLAHGYRLDLVDPDELAPQVRGRSRSVKTRKGTT